MSLKKTDQTLCFLVGLCFSVGATAKSCHGPPGVRHEAQRCCAGIGSEAERLEQKDVALTTPGAPGTPRRVRSERGVSELHWGANGGRWPESIWLAEWAPSTPSQVPGDGELGKTQANEAEGMGLEPTTGKPGNTVPVCLLANSLTLQAGPILL